MTIGSVETELQYCRERCAGVQVGDWMHRLHHTTEIEVLTEPIGNRIGYILMHKPVSELATRLHFMGPWSGAVPTGLTYVQTVCQRLQDERQATLVRLMSLEEEYPWAESVCLLAELRRSQFELTRLQDKSRRLWEEYSSSPAGRAAHASLFPDCPRVRP